MTAMHVAASENNVAALRVVDFMPAVPLYVVKSMSEAEREPKDLEYDVGTWDHVSPTAVIEEYMENMYQCVSSI